MPRSDYVYALVVSSMIEPAATFTVKHELRTYLLGLGRVESPLLSDLRLFRMDDGHEGMKAEMDIDEVMNGR